MAKDLAGFIRALHALDLPGGPPAGRGATLERWDEPARAALVELEGDKETNPLFAENARYRIGEVLADVSSA
jgi:aminoglycoside phosphotransferase (APT) family kinase protein